MSPIRAAAIVLLLLVAACSEEQAARSSGGGEDDSSTHHADSSIERSDSGLSREAGKDGGEATDVGIGSDGEAGPHAWTCPPGPFGSPIPSGATLTRIAAVPPSDAFNGSRSAYTTVEGPVWIGDALLVSEILGSPNPPPARILEVTPLGSVSVLIADSGSNGLAVDSSGSVYGAVHADGSVSRFDLTTGTRTPVATGYMGHRFNSPNDLTVRSDGNIYFSDPTYQAPTPPPQSSTRVYRIAAGTNAVTVVDATLTQPNGVTLSLDENTLYVTSAHGLYTYPVMPDGSTGPGTVFAASVDGDGMVMDCAGNLYVALVGTGNVAVLSPSGAPIGELSATGVGAVTNTAFGGPDHKTLYVSAQGSGGEQGLFSATLDIPGMPY